MEETHNSSEPRPAGSVSQVRSDAAPEPSVDGRSDAEVQRDASAPQNGANDRLSLHLQKRKPPSVSQPTRSSSLMRRSCATPARSSVTAATDAASHLRLRGVISSARYSAVRHSAVGGFSRVPTTALTDSERAAMAAMADVEERRRAAQQRAAEDEERRGQMLIAMELEKESASLNRIVELEKKKLARIQAKKEKEVDRMMQAKLRREAMERERQKKLDLLQQKRTEKILHHDPYAMRRVMEKYKRQGSK